MGKGKTINQRGDRLLKVTSAEVLVGGCQKQLGTRAAVRAHVGMQGRRGQTRCCVPKPE